MDSFSPTIKLLKRRIPPPPPVEQIPLLIPPLHSLSDVQWLLWSELVGNNAGKLRYIGRDHIINDDTEAMMKHIFQAKKGVDMLPWPGLSFIIETDEAKTLLAAPNSKNAIWPMTDHAAVRGRRRPNVTIWYAQNG
ncbi:MAG: hypothetical protein Q9218_001137, partial [Villophora microphyllina]